MRAGFFQGLKGWVVAAYVAAAILSAFAHHPASHGLAALAEKAPDLTAYVLPDGTTPDVCLTSAEDPAAPEPGHGRVVCEACLFAASHLLPPVATDAISPPLIVLKSRVLFPTTLARQASVDRPRARAPPVLIIA